MLNNNLMKKSLTAIRWIVGLLFIFSGLIKANDPLGLSYKMQEFFEAWGLEQLNDYTVVLAVIMNVFEVLAGVGIILGRRIKMFSWLLLILIFVFCFSYRLCFAFGQNKNLRLFW